MRRTYLPVLLAAAGASAACSFQTQGITPPPREFHYPIAEQVSPDARYLYVVNSDFDLAYNGGAVNVVDLDAVRAEIAAAGDALPVRPDARCDDRQAAAQSQCEGRFIATSLGSTVGINPFATAAAVANLGPLPGDTTDRYRLYITVRGDGTLTYMDLFHTVSGSAGTQVIPNFSELRCGNSDTDFRCDQEHRPGNDPVQSGPRGLVMPPLPTALDVTDPRFVTVVHQESPQARMSLFQVNLDAAAETETAPRILHYLGGLSANLDAILRADPPGQRFTNHAGDARDAHSDAHWYAFSRVEPVIHHVHVFYDDDRSFLWRSHVTVLTTLASDVGIRAVVRDPCGPYAYASARPRTPDYSAYGVYGTTPTYGTVAASGDQLIKFDLTDPDNPTVVDVMAMPAGPENLVAVVPDGINADGTCRGDTYLYVVAFNAAKLYAVNGTQWREDDEVRTQVGPHALVADPLLGTAPEHNYLYLADFTAMVVEVIDVDPNRPTRNSVVFTIGDPRPPETT